jgi:hypothetical protein
MKNVVKTPKKRRQLNTVPFEIFESNKEVTT